MKEKKTKIYLDYSHAKCYFPVDPLTIANKKIYEIVDHFRLNGNHKSNKEASITEINCMPKENNSNPKSIEIQTYSESIPIQIVHNKDKSNENNNFQLKKVSFQKNKNQVINNVKPKEMTYHNYLETISINDKNEKYSSDIMIKEEKILAPEIFQNGFQSEALLESKNLNDQRSIEKFHKNQDELINDIADLNSIFQYYEKETKLFKDNMNFQKQNNVY